MTTFDFEFHNRYRWLLLPLAVTPGNSRVSVSAADGFFAKFGPWKVKTPISNITGFQESGDYKWYRAIGIRGSATDHGLTFGSTTRHGVCLTFAEPIAPLIPLVKGHPGLTVTVADPAGLVAALQALGITPN